MHDSTNLVSLKDQLLTCVDRVDSPLSRQFLQHASTASYITLDLSVCPSYRAIVSQESCAIAKMTAQCALYMGVLKNFGTP